MASVPHRAEIVLTIPVEQYIGSDINGNLILNVRAGATKTMRFLRQLRRLCKKYGYTVGEIQKQKSEDK